MAEEAAIEQYGADGIEVYHAFFKPLEFTIAENEVDAKSCYMKVENIRDIIIIIIFNLMSLFFQDKSRLWTAASQQHKVDNQPLATWSP